MGNLSLARALVKTSSEKIVRDAADTNEIKELIIFLNTERQLFTQNVDSKGNKLADNDPFGGYSIRTMQSKGISDPTKVTLKDTGAFYNTFRVVVLNNGDYAIDANTSIHGEDLEIRWGNEIIGLLEQNAAIVEKEIEKEAIRQLLRKYS